MPPEESPDDARAEARTVARSWTIGAALLIAGAVIGASGTLNGFGVSSTFVGELVVAAAFLVFALGERTPGIRRTVRAGDLRTVRGSVVGGSVLGMVGLIGLAVVIVVGALVGLILGLTNLDAPRLAVGIVTDVLEFLFAFAAVAEIVRAKTVPRPWCWAPVGVLAAFVLARALVQLPLAPPSSPFPTSLVAAGVLSLVVALLTTGSVVALGVLATVLADRVRRGEVVPGPLPPLAPRAD